MNTLKEKYNKEIRAALKASLGLSNDLEVPRVKKVTINARLSSKKDPKAMEVIENTLRRITGQKPVLTRARKSIAGFKVRENMVVGAMVTLRGERAWDFIEKLVNVTFPRIRDFRGITTTTVDSYGNFNVGFKEHTAFPEISSDEIEALHGLQVTITTTATNQKEGMALFQALGFPFKK
ncbi:MAG: 50S ribosomal protein L5 [Patescibacteria group bacterium]|jgi:large subunit ribosomal protein L5